MATLFKALAGITAFIILGNLFTLIIDGLNWLALNLPFGTEIFGLGIIALIFWGAFKVATIVLNKIEWKN